jgi:amino acid transporter
MRVAVHIHGSGGGRSARLFRHLLEMTIAMMLGMAVLGALFREVHVLAFGAGFDNAWRNHTELAVFAMTFNMTLPMIALMRYRRHSWERCGEMSSAMFALALALLVPFWLGVVSAGVVLPLEMALMLPAMILMMLVRVDDYAEPHPATGVATPSPVGAARPR